MTLGVAFACGFIAGVIVTLTFMKLLFDFMEGD